MQGGFRFLSVSVILVSLLLLTGSSVPSSSSQNSESLNTSSFTRSIRSVRVGLRNRRYYLIVPNTFQSNPKPVLLLALYGGLGNARKMMEKSGLTEVAVKHGYLLAYLEGTSLKISRQVRTWNAGRCCGRASRLGVGDVGYISRVIEDVKQLLNLKAVKVVLIGHSNGAMMAYRAACEIPTKISAVISVSGALVYEGCDFTAAKDIAILHIHGRDDENVPVNGGQWQRSVANVVYPPLRETIEAFANPRKKV